MRKALFIAAALTFVTLAATGTRANQQHACHDDAFKFCRNVIPDHALIHHCLRRNHFHLSRACQAHIRPL